MKYDANTLAKRKPLWIALSDLFLDTELQDSSLKRIAKTMKNSNYSLDEMTLILQSEVFPVCIGNLHVIPGGVWTGFDEDELVEAIISAKPPNRFKRWLNRRRFSMIEDDWNRILKHYEAL